MANCYLNKYFTALVILMLALATSGHAMQQDTTAKGSTRPGMAGGLVLDEYGNPLKGVKVAVKGKADTTRTDRNGRFEISAAANNTLVFKAANYSTREVAFKGSDVTVRLIDTYIKAPSKINVLYGTADADKNLGSISTIYTNQLTSTPATLYTYALPGQLAGLYTQQRGGFAIPQTSGQTNADFIGNVVQHNNYQANDNTEFFLNLRGQSPITIIDGVQREISSLDPESIESVSVLKDGLSSILLGVNSSRGIILITTKRAQAGAPKISFTAQTASQTPLGLPTPLPTYQYAYLYNEALQNDGKLPIYSAADFAAYRDGSDPTRHPDVNWYNTVLRKNSPMTSYKLNVNGGSEIARYSVSLNYMNQDGMFNTAPDVTYNTNNNLNRYIINTDVTVNVTKKFVVDLQMFGRIQSQTQPGAGYSNILGALYSTPNNAYPVRNPDGSFAGTTTYTNNLLAQTEYSGYQKTNSNDVLANLDLTYDMSSITKGLSGKAMGNLALSSQSLVNRSLQNNVFLIKSDDSYAGVGSPSSQQNNFSSVSSARYFYGQLALNYDRTFGKHNFTGKLMYDTRSMNLNFDLTATTTNEALKAGYNYDGKYFIEGAVNRSGYSRYAPGRQFGVFYAGGLGWQMGKEDFIKDNLSFISSWKWRATYGRTGNGNVDNYGYYNFIQTYGSPNGYQYSTGSSRSDVQGVFANSLANPLISWEKADKIDVGADIALFNNHLSVTADYYHDRYKDLLQVRGRSILLLGTPYSVENIGVVLNTGTEFTLTYQNNINNFNYFFSGNASVQKSTSVFSDETPTPYPWLRRTGQSTDAIYGYKALGFFNNAQEAATSATTTGYTAQAGDVKYADLNNDGVINQFDITNISNNKALIYYGASLGFNYKGFGFSMIIQGVENRQFLFDNSMVNGFAGIGFLGLTYAGQGYDNLTGRWTPETAATATLPRLTTGNANNTAYSSLYVRSGDYIRLKNAEVSYNLPFSWVKKLRLSGVRLFANGENLVTFYGYKGIDPEVSNGAYPIQRVVNAGFTVKL
ncbi:SusC/RagA family TonB-linked outer membrane protein [Mucilaginibacter sp. ZT4R22]|uniref:SusC/RagA family TonB-linked outer membrane protein n=1 Tax=Mucilaginibacter pankratovii TaxID=2772110 RepID=A0ABR7WY46_9SPHI|nr:SusC/RagA family TonB-linked outer membrane protein [Mucilaginibacter pankratovii]MBD1367206.1 SusC/RagA family TonB-linked outer membrane protein [Mucilaginibacter pankratovii]